MKPIKFKKARVKKEESLQLAIAKYLRLQFPHVIFTSESSGIRLTMGQAVKAKQLRSIHKLPDMIILHPSVNQFYSYHGLCLEIKKESPYKKDGTLKKDKHLEEQLISLNLLRELNYKAQFVWTFDVAKEIIDHYLI